MFASTTAIATATAVAAVTAAAATTLTIPACGKEIAQCVVCTRCVSEIKKGMPRARRSYRAAGRSCGSSRRPDERGERSRQPENTTK